MSKLRGGAKVTKPLFKFDFKCLVANSKCLNKTQRITLTLGGGKNSSFFLFVPLFSCGLGTFCFQLLLQSLLFCILVSVCFCYHSLWVQFCKNCLNGILLLLWSLCWFLVEYLFQILLLGFISVHTILVEAFVDDWIEPCYFNFSGCLLTFLPFCSLGSIQGFVVGHFLWN